MDVTAILKQMGDSNEGLEALFPIVYSEMRAIAGRMLRHERRDHTLDPTALVHEAYVKLVHQETATFDDRRHFYAVAARAMRQILVDHARRRAALKRGGPRLKVTLNEEITPAEELGIDLLALDEALTKLSSLGERRSRVVELRFFGGLTNQEAADALGVSPKTTEADWYFARAWLRRAMEDETTA